MMLQSVRSEVIEWEMTLLMLQKGSMELRQVMITW